jgi:uncharacterized glyoxalase superfamily protein PhnB
MAKKTPKKKSAGRTRPAAKTSRKVRAKKPARPAKRASAPRRPAAIPPGMHTVTPSLLLSDSAAAISFYKQAFGAQELRRMLAPDGRSIWHAALRIGDSVIFLNDAVGMPMRPPSKEQPSTTAIWLYVPDCDAVFERAVKAGAAPTMPMSDAFWGDRMGMLTDPFGIRWGVATHVKDMTDEEMRRAGEAFAREMASGAASSQTDIGGGQPQAQA